jgi:hypothetical protein
VKTPLPDPAHNISGSPSRRDRVATAAWTAPGTRPRTGTSPTSSTANTGRITGHSLQLLLRTSTADAGTPVLSPAAGCPVSSSVHKPDPEEAEVSAASAADSAAASGIGARLQGEPVRGSKHLGTPRHFSSCPDASESKIIVNCNAQDFFSLNSVISLTSNPSLFVCI